ALALAMTATRAAWIGSISLVRSPSFHFLIGQPRTSRIAARTSMPMTADQGRPGSENPWLSSTTSTTTASTVPITAHTTRVDEEVLCIGPSLSDHDRLWRGDPSDFLIVEFAQDLSDRSTALRGVDVDVTDEFDPRSQHERTLVSARMRQDQTLGVADELVIAVTEADEVDVEGPRPP